MCLRTFFFVTAFITTISPLSSACAMSHKFGYVAFLFSIKKFSNFPFWEFFLPIGCSGMDCLFSTYLWIFQFFFFFWFSFILLWLEKSVGMISIFLSLLKLVIYPEECPVCVEECILLHLHGMFSRCLSSTICLW